MIQELVNYTQILEKEFADDILELEEGFHAIIDLDSTTEIYKSYLHREGQEIPEEFLKLPFIEKKSQALGDNKGIVDKKIFSNNLYTLYFKLFFPSNEDDKNTLKNLSDKFTKIKSVDKTIFDFQEIKTKFEQIFPEDLSNSKMKILEYYKRIEEKYFEEIYSEDFEKIKDYVKNELSEKLKEDQNFIYEILYTKDKKNNLILNNKFLGTQIRIHFKTDEENINNLADIYFSKNAALKDDYNQEVDGMTYSLSPFMNTDNEKKVFLKHKTASFDISSKIPEKYISSLKQFEDFKKNLPNPLPIFIYEDELNSEYIKIFKKDSKLKFSEIIKQILEIKKSDVLSNYYLLFFKGLELKDYDFISNFEYKKDFKILPIFKVFKTEIEIQNKKEIKKYKDITETQNIKNVFEFEDKIVQKIFNNSLVVHSKDKKNLKYFDDIDKTYTDESSSIIYNLVLKYRKAIYDYIYKSKLNAITNKMFDDMMRESIINDLKKSNNDHNRANQIKEKLNIWFSLYTEFSIPKKENPMPSKIKEYREKLKSFSVNSNSNKPSLDTDEEFAFASGQIIYKILIQNESSNRTHALLEPFLNKTNLVEFKKAIAREFERYKHKFTLYSGKFSFDLVMAEVMGYDTKEIQFKELLPFILAGYFAETVFKKEEETKGQTNE